MGPSNQGRTPVIDCTDLYHPHQDPGDNFDIIAAYALPEIDLRAVILDITDDFRKPEEEQPAGRRDPFGPREPGIVPMMQMNYIFDRDVPHAVSPFTLMRSPDDKMLDVPRFGQAGVELMLRTLRESEEPVTIMVFCSCRTLAAAMNREPELVRQKVRRVLLSIGTTSGEMFDVDYGERKRLPVKEGSAGYREWNVELDPHAFVRVLRSGLPMSLYPCACDGGPFAMHRHDSYYDLGGRGWIRRMHPKLRNYLAFVFERSNRPDFLRAMDDAATEEALQRLDAATHHHVWETAVWLEASGRKLVRRADRTHRIVAADEIAAGDVVLPNEQRPCRLNVHDDGRFDFELIDGESEVTIYDRGEDLEAHAAAMGEALKALYESFVP
ncbi:MAG: nucleoside hydrolase [Phycisphaerales bacterium]